MPCQSARELVARRRRVLSRQDVGRSVLGLLVLVPHVDRTPASRGAARLSARGRVRRGVLDDNMARMSLGLALLAACTRAPAEPAPPGPASQRSELRARQELVWRPGDAEAVRRQVVRTVPIYSEGASVQPMLFFTEIRNRCGEAASFVVGPEDAVAGPDAPSNTLAAGEAVVVLLASEEWVHLRAASGDRSLKASATGGWIVLTGDAACDAIAGIDR